MLESDETQVPRLRISGTVEIAESLVSEFLRVVDGSGTATPSATAAGGSRPTAQIQALKLGPVVFRDGTALIEVDATLALVESSELG